MLKVVEKREEREAGEEVLLLDEIARKGALQTDGERLHQHSQRAVLSAARWSFLLIIGRWRAGVAIGLAFVSAVGIAAGGQDMGVMGQAVQQRRAQLLVAKDFGPLREGQIGCDDGRAPFVTLGQQIEQQLALGAFEGYESQRIDHQQRDFLITLLQHGEPPFVARLQ